jgi:hypothetical protein
LLILVAGEVTHVVDLLIKRICPHTKHVNRPLVITFIGKCHLWTVLIVVMMVRASDEVVWGLALSKVSISRTHIAHHTLHVSVIVFAKLRAMTLIVHSHSRMRIVVLVRKKMLKLILHWGVGTVKLLINWRGARRKFSWSLRACFLLHHEVIKIVHRLDSNSLHLLRQRSIYDALRLLWLLIRLILVRLLACSIRSQISITWLWRTLILFQLSHHKRF